jgi:hypothetical protein
VVQKYLSDTVQNKKFRISICFFSLQSNPKLLLPWMMYTIFFLFANTALYIAIDALYLSTIIGAVVGATYIVLAIVYIGK